jgi:hypothetical protein
MTNATPSFLDTAIAYMAVMDQVEGWLSVPCARLLCLLHAAQRSQGVRGDLFEIGVHHGKSALLLSCFVDPATEWLLVNDLFAQQDRNISHSGAGDQSVFLDHFARLRPGFRSVRLFPGPSQQLSKRETGTNCRIFHIDGGHSAVETLMDLQTAAVATHEAGVIVIDDYFNQDFPAVSEGVNQFLRTNDSIRPFLLGFNKMYLCRRERLARYAESLPDPSLMAAFSLGCRRIEFYGNPVMIFFDLPEQDVVRLDITLPVSQMTCRSGQSLRVDVRVTNAGRDDITELPGRAVRLDYHQYQENALQSWDNRRVSLWPLAAGQTRVVSYDIVAPAEPGRYRYDFDGVIENVAWLSELGGSPASLSIQVLLGDATSRRS